MSSSKIQERNLDPNMGLAKEETAQEILSKMGQGVTAQCIKSIQKVEYTLNKSKSSDSVTIQPVTAANCIALYSVQYCTYDSTPKVLYTIHDDHVTFEFFESSSATTIVYLWIIEFYM